MDIQPYVDCISFYWLYYLTLMTVYSLTLMTGTMCAVCASFAFRLRLYDCETTQLCPVLLGGDQVIL